MTSGRYRRRSAFAVALLVCLTLSGCEAQPGPLEFGRPDGGSARICAPAVDQPWLVGDAFQTPDSSIHVDGMHLVGATGIGLLGAWLTTEQGSIGAVEYPPSSQHVDDWDRAVEAAGADVSAHTLQTFAVEVQATGRDGGHADAVAIDYSIEGVRFTAVGTLSIDVADPCT